jgi:hypothetical protein
MISFAKGQGAGKKREGNLERRKLHSFFRPSTENADEKKKRFLNQSTPCKAVNKGKKKHPSRNYSKVLESGESLITISKYSLAWNCHRWFQRAG